MKKFRFFRSPNRCGLADRHYYAVPADGTNTGRKALTGYIGNKIKFGFLNWCLEELLAWPAVEITQAQFEKAIKTKNWLKAYERAH